MIHLLYPEERATAIYRMGSCVVIWAVLGMVTKRKIDSYQKSNIQAHHFADWAVVADVGGKYG